MNIGLVLGGGSLLHQVARDLATALDRQFARFDVTAQQAALLLRASAAPSSPSQLMDVLGTDTAGMTKLLDRLEAKGFIARRPNPDDRRSVLIEPTEQGEKLVPKLAPVFGRVTMRLFAGVADDEIATFTALLTRMRANLAAPQVETPGAG
jgi:DNA-binding MarR family transcriptional regulator